MSLESTQLANDRDTPTNIAEKARELGTLSLTFLGIITYLKGDRLKLALTKGEYTYLERLTSEVLVNVLPSLSDPLEKRSGSSSRLETTQVILCRYQVEIAGVKYDLVTYAVGDYADTRRKDLLYFKKSSEQRPSLAQLLAARWTEYKGQPVSES